MAYVVKGYSPFMALLRIPMSAARLRWPGGVLQPEP